MVAGHARCGKTSFAQTLTAHCGGIAQKCADLVEPFTLDGFAMGESVVTVVDTPGLSVPLGIHKASFSTRDALKWQAKTYADSLAAFCKVQFKATFDQEVQLKRDKKLATDTRVHLCLYLVDPEIIKACKGLTEMDITVLKTLTKSVNVLVCLSKSDLITKKDIEIIRQCLRSDLTKHHISTFTFEFDEDSQRNLNNYPFLLTNSEILKDSPFEMGISVSDEVVLGREYVWGVVETLNRAHCDFLLLKEAMLEDYIDDLRARTNEELYENWRSDHIEQLRYF
jgi:septin family protein